MECNDVVIVVIVASSIFSGKGVMVSVRAGKNVDENRLLMLTLSLLLNRWISVDRDKGRYE